ncbi:hypothetical protein GDO86_018245 [Hymenochirus boettgeri]|uniref:Dynein heavy chain C-terminal domain-containing protein n=1 Tax=Hymenochirus boettgeri TaxID=247094 RepID=A0A8T2IEL0_9PIPI|nr:hypothetical protein GDO86_018245 [Hymenochirus boettgeri]
MTRKRLLPLRKFLQNEWDSLRTRISQAVRDLRAAMCPCYCLTCGDVRTALSRGLVPQGWNWYSPGATIDLLAWVQEMKARLNLLWSYVSSPSPLNNSYNISVFQHPVRLLHCLLQEKAWKDSRDLDQYTLYMQVSDRRPLSPDVYGLTLTGLYIKHALWDTRQSFLQETLSHKLCALPEVRVSVIPKDEIPVSPVSLYLCPVYPSYVATGSALCRESAVLLLPLPSHIPPSVWSVRGVHAISLL